jgi:beta-glucosidase
MRRNYLAGIFSLLSIFTASAQNPPTSDAPAGTPTAASAVSTAIPVVSTPVCYTDPSLPVAQRVADLISRLSLAEKVAQLQNASPAVSRLHIPAYDYWSEGLHGVGFAGRATVFPQTIGMAATWDADLIHREGQTVANEGRAKFNSATEKDKGKRFHGLCFWSPNVNIFRDPRWGRGQETYGEDPLLTGDLAVAFITGIQGDPLHPEALACAKHYAVHSGPEPERHRFNVNPSEIDLHETYLPAFEACVRDGHVAQVMSSYNAVYGVPVPASKLLLTDILRHTWGFDGYVVSDCDAVADIVRGHHYRKTMAEAVAAALQAGTDLDCGRAYAALVEAVEKKLVTDEEIDTALTRVLTERFRLGLFDPSTPWDKLGEADNDTAASSALALRAARESIVLLKNDGLLPLDRGRIKHLAIIGGNARDTTMLLGNYHGTPSHPVSIFDGIAQAAGGNVQVDYAAGPPLAVKLHTTMDANSPGWQEAMKAAQGADVIVYVGGINSDKLEREENHTMLDGFLDGDRTRIELPEVQEKFVEALGALHKPLIFVNCSGSAMALKWEADNLPAIIQAWYPGENGGTAVGEVLFGDVNPSGHLPITFYAGTDDLPAFTDYSMANRTYRYFSGRPLFAFGHGLSYTRFDFGAPRLSATTLNAGGTIHLSVPVTNSGPRDGDEVVQVYVKQENSNEPRPVRSLAAFRRISVPKGGTVNAELDLPAHQLRHWDVATHAYVVTPGSYEMEIGAASDDIRQKREITAD